MVQPASPLIGRDGPRDGRFSHPKRTFIEQTSLRKRGLFLVPIRVKVPIERFALLPSADPGILAASGQILVMAAGANGRVTHTEEIPVSLRVDARRLAAGTEPDYAQRLELHLERGYQRVAIGVWDEVARQGSFLGRAVVVGAVEP